MKTRSGELLRDLVRGGDLPASEIRAELNVDIDEFDELLVGTRVMSLAHQLCFAALVAERVPRLARRAQALRGQAAAAVAFRDHATLVHASAPLAWSRLKLR